MTLVPRISSVLSISGYRIALIGVLTLHISTGARAAELLSFQEAFGAEDVDRLSALSDDGRIAVGSSKPEHPANEVASIWSLDDGFELLGRLSFDDVLRDLKSELQNSWVYWSYPHAMTPDGQVVVGRTNVGSDFGTNPRLRAHANGAFRWTRETGMQPLDNLDGFEFSHASDVSDDGSVIVGRAIEVDLNEYEEEKPNWLITRDVPVVWTANGVHRIPLPDGFREGWAFRVSGDGRTVIGSMESEEGDRQGFVWSDENGTVAFDAISQGFLAGDVSRDGSIFVGQSSVIDPDGQSVSTRATRWSQEDGLVELSGFPEATINSAALHISASGDLILGLYSDGDSHAFVWDELNEVRDLAEVLASDYGLEADLSDWQLTSVKGISADRRVLYGAGSLLEASRNWIAYLDEPLGPRLENPGDFDSDGQLTVQDIDRLAKAIRRNSTLSVFDLDASGAIDANDLGYLVQDMIGTYLGDANLDSEFNTGDLVQVLEAGEYETQQEAGWSEGDWNGDGVFDTGDLVKALEGGGYEMGPREPIAVPEPSAVALLISGALIAFCRRRESPMFTCRI